jgi:hypothetical protein
MNSKKNIYETIDNSIKKMMSDGKIDQYDIPELILLLTELSTQQIIPSSTEDLHVQINDLYAYVMKKYDLYPKNVEERAVFDKLFQSSVKLVLYQPVLRSKCSKFWSGICKK